MINKVIGLLLVVYSVYWSIENLPRAIQTFDFNNHASTLILVAIALMFIAGVGFLVHRGFAHVLNWISVIIFGVLVFTYHAAITGFNSYTFLIIAVALAIVGTVSSRHSF